VVGLGSAGDVHPNVGLAMALRQRGHEVLLVAPVVFRDLAERTGLEFAGVFTEEECTAALHDPDLWHPYRSFPVVARRLILPAMRPVYGIIEKNMKPGRTVVVAPGLAFGARIAQEKLGVPLASVHLQPVMLRSVIRPACFGFPDLLGHLPRPLRRLYLRAADRFLIDAYLAGETNAFRAELGLPPVRRLFDGWAHSPQRIIGLFPDWFAPPPPDWPPNVVLTGFPLWDESDIRTPSQELLEFLAAGEPPIVFTAGSAMAQAGRFFQVSAEVCRATGRRGSLLTQFPEQLPAALPEGVRHFDYVPFSVSLPRAAVLVHHGGIGTTAQAIAAGVPQLVVPAAHDQPDNAVRVRGLGVGEFLLPRSYTTANVIKVLDRLMTPRIKQNCTRLAANIGCNRALEQTCGVIEALAPSAVQAPGASRL
jgi:UDP:flavonoid glycosyltransferase YjiC (YdhE family)